MSNETKQPEKETCKVIFHQMTPEEEKAEIERLKEKTLMDEISAKYYYSMTGYEEGFSEGFSNSFVETFEKLYLEKYIRVLNSFSEMKLAEGIEKGKSIEKAEITEKMRKIGMSEEQIQKIIE